MQDYTRLKAQALTAVEKNGVGERDDIAWLLVLEQLIFQTEAEARWLDHCESRLIRLSSTAPATGPEPGAAGMGARAGAGAEGPHATARDVRPARPALSTRTTGSTGPTESTGSTRPYP